VGPVTAVVDLPATASTVARVRLVLPGRPARTLASGWLVPLSLGAVLVVVLSAASAAAFETRTVTSFWRGLWWAISLITTVGFVGEPPETLEGAVLSAVLMVIGFLLLATVSASLAALFVHEEERPWEERDRDSDEALTAALDALDRRLTAIEGQLDRLAAGPPAAPAGRTTDAPPVGDAGPGS
jgi:Ion channel